ncbi:hypothetical protein FFK22_040135 [Mycobacterium sp. KBS0706]|uniref:hypothetical protein n=1 Tax=Mycobacterium sp. KBS0706 TaxID=2578109 RepID=UPI00110FC2EA|nr:hypothetical protein [Mycobacterium sp. KBS0706]TSD82988.1 hypothetical protein FFK22_040135 [Mycobacterium sp. KBS0706]
MASTWEDQVREFRELLDRIIETQAEHGRKIDRLIQTQAEHARILGRMEKIADDWQEIEEALDEAGG